MAAIVLGTLVVGAGLFALLTGNGEDPIGPGGPTGVTNGVSEFVVAQIPGRPSAIAVDAGVPFVASNDGGGAIFRVSPTSGATERISVGPDPGRIAFTGTSTSGDLWVINRGDGTVSRIRLPFSAGSEAQQMPVAARPSRIIAPISTGAVWVLSEGEGTLTRIDASTAGTESLRVGTAPRAMVFGLMSIWVANTGSDSVTRVEPDPVGEIATIRVQNQPTSVSFGFDRIWVANTVSGTLSVIDGSTNTVERTLDVGAEPMGLNVDLVGALWVRNTGETTVSRIDADTFAIQSIDVGGHAVALAKTAGSMWVTTDDGGLWRLDIATGEGDRIELGHTPVAMAADTDAIWISGRRRCRASDPCTRPGHPDVESEARPVGDHVGLHSR